MFAFKHVLVATDFGKPAERAEQLGIAFAEGFERDACGNAVGGDSCSGQRDRR